MKCCCLLLLTMALLAGCKKTDNPLLPHDRYPHNRLKASVAISGSTPFVLDALGGLNTVYKRRLEGPQNDTVITIEGVRTRGIVTIKLINITKKGTYSLAPATDPAHMAYCQFKTGDPAKGPYEVYSTQFTNGEGSIFIDSLTDQYISGRFWATASKFGNPSLLTQFVDGFFSGNLR